MNTFHGWRKSHVNTQLYFSDTNWVCWKGSLPQTPSYITDRRAYSKWKCV